MRHARTITLLATGALMTSASAFADPGPPRAAPAPAPATAAISAQDRVYSGDQFSNTVSVINPATNTLEGVIRLGEPQPANFNPRYRGQLLVHGLGFAPDGKTLAVVSIGSNAVSFIDTATNKTKATTYLGRAPHEAFYTPNGKELWVTIRGEDYVSVIDAATYAEKTRIKVPGGPGMQIFSPDGKYGYICSSFSPETVVVDVAKHVIVGRVKQDSPFCPNIAATPDGRQVWMTLKDIGRVMVFDAKPPFAVIKTIDTGAITNHVNFAKTASGLHAYVSVGGLNQIKVFRTDTFAPVTQIPVGNMPHGLWPSADGSRIFVGLENANQMMVIDTAINKVVAEIPTGQAPQAVVYVPGAVSTGDGKGNLEPLGLAGKSIRMTLNAVGAAAGAAQPTNVTLFDQGLTQILQASVTGLKPGTAYMLALATKPDGTGKVEPLATFKTSPEGSAIVNAVGPIRQIVRGGAAADSARYLVIVPGTADMHDAPVQIQAR